MSGVVPFFITGANAKIKVNGKTLAFCSSVSYEINVAHATPKVLGMYEGTSVEPLGYSVGGSLTIIRYAKQVRDMITKEYIGNLPTDVSPNGNGIGNLGTKWDQGKYSADNILFNGRANEAFDPSRLSQGVTFDIQIYQKMYIPSKMEYKQIGIANIRDARFVKSAFVLDKRGAAQQQFQFVALYADEDSFAADFSGTEQKFD